MSKISIKSVNDLVTDKGLHFKGATFGISSNLSFEVKPAIRTDNLLKVTKDKIGPAHITEHLVKLTLDKLDEIDSKPGLQQDFIEENMVEKTSSGLALNVVKVLLRKDQMVTDTQVKYLSNIFTLYSYKGISVVPLLYHYETRIRSRVVKGGKSTFPVNEVLEPVDYETYYEFVKGFINEVKERKYTDQLVMSLPARLKHSKIPDYLELYKDIETPIIMQDGMGREQIAFQDNIREVINGKGYSMAQKNGEKFILYGFDSKKVSFGGRPTAINPAKNVEQLLYGYSTFGAQYTWPKMKIEQKPENKGFKPSGRIYLSDEMGYAKKDYKTAQTDIELWIEKNVPKGIGKDYRNYAKNYEAFKLIESFEILNQGAKEGNLDSVISKTSLENDLERIRKTS